MLYPWHPGYRVSIKKVTLPTVFCSLPDDDLHSGILSVPCNFTTTSRICLNCHTRVVCKSIGGLVKPCRRLDKPYCVDGRCTARPSINCAAYGIMGANNTVTIAPEDTVNMENTTEGNSTTTSNIENTTTEGDSREGSTSQGSTTEGGTTDDTSDESPSDGTSKGTTDENSTTESISDDTTDKDESELIAEGNNNDE
ncbi:papilin-like [Hyposmocoma kahamanoa]|uniref:papilin-like n=1 Tax=Hyposmocoma kahamanoa TaxID=1477025 RepID=UPI000E6D6972|nr:papilin-like [Hyposmocoma kahamanoa]